MKIILSFTLLLSTISYAQSQEPLAELIQAEKKFAATSAEKSTKQAFVENLSDEAILFRRGIVNGKKFWSEAPDGNDKLTWGPQYAAISVGGDFGYTTGPFEVFQNRTDAQPAGAGHYLSVWQKENGKWKVLIDAGVNHQPADLSTWETASKIGTVKSNASSANVLAEVKTAESAYQEAFKQKGASALLDFLSDEIRVYRPSKAPYRKNNIAELVAETDKKFIYEPSIDTKVAPAGDIAFNYGNVGIEITRDGNTRQLKGNYLRIWKKENGREWKIVADLISL